MKQRKPMNRGSGFKRPERPERVRQALVPAAEKVRAFMRPAELHAIPKPETADHEGYMELVRAMPCAHCGWPPRSQFCHSDEGKGTGTKSDCRFGWPGCGPHLQGFVMVNGCHYEIGTKRIYPKQQRREIEFSMARQTRQAIVSAGLWPANLPRINDEV